MKKISIFIMSVGLLFTACNDSFLDSEPITSQTAEGYFKTPKNALEGLTGCYNGLVQDEWTNMLFISSIASDEAFPGGGQGEAGAGVPYGWDEFKEAGNMNQNADIWRNRYRAIYRCNSFIENLGGVSWEGSDDLSLQYEAEARFLRAYFYFDLVKFFGNIPLVTTSEVSNTKQSEPEDVYAFIASDLKFAVENLPGTPYGDISSDDYGHATKWAAESLMARVFLFYTGRYSKSDLAGIVTKAEALAYLEDVIDNSGHDLVPEFKNLWPVASISGEGEYVGEDNIETVFAAKYTWGTGWDAKANNRWLIQFGLRWHDGTPAPYSWGWGQATVSKKYWNEVYEADDTRKTASILSIADELQNSTSTKDGDVVDPTGAPFNSDQFADYTGYFNKKYIPLTASKTDFLEYPKSIQENNNPQVDQFQDWVIIRFADVLLMAAELGSPNAQNYLDRVRDRAFGDTDHRVAVSVDAIRNERMAELFFEGVRYWDLLRYGSDVAAQEINTTEVVLEGGVEKTKKVVFDTEKDGLFQIPWNQIDLSYENGEAFLTQNPGW